MEMITVMVVEVMVMMLLVNEYSPVPIATQCVTLTRDLVVVDNIRLGYTGSLLNH